MEILELLYWVIVTPIIVAGLANWRKLDFSWFNQAYLLSMHNKSAYYTPLIAGIFMGYIMFFFHGNSPDMKHLSYLFVFMLLSFIAAVIFNKFMLDSHKSN